METHISFTFGPLNKIFLGICALMCLSCDCSENFILKGTKYEMCTYPCHTIFYDNDMVIEDYVTALSWNQQYIIAYSKPASSEPDKYYFYIVEQCKPDTVVMGVPKYFNRNPWKLEKFREKQAFYDRIEQLYIDTSQMQHWPKQ